MTGRPDELSPSRLCSPSRRTRGADVGVGGRRLDGVSDHETDLGDKDLLPAYDHLDGPPKYIELGVRGYPEGFIGMTVLPVPERGSPEPPPGAAELENNSER